MSLTLLSQLLLTGNWSVSDDIRITVFKLTDLAKDFYGSCVELQGAEVT